MTEQDHGRRFYCNLPLTDCCQVRHDREAASLGEPVGPSVSHDGKQWVSRVRARPELSLPDDPHTAIALVVSEMCSKCPFKTMSSDATEFAVRTLAAQRYQALYPTQVEQPVSSNPDIQKISA